MLTSIVESQHQNVELGLAMGCTVDLSLPILALI